jgi:hypothetical protein
MCLIQNGYRILGAHVNVAEDLILWGCDAVTGYVVLVALLAQVGEGTVIFKVLDQKRVMTHPRRTEAHILFDVCNSLKVAFVD